MKNREYIKKTLNLDLTSDEVCDVCDAFNTDDLTSLGALDLRAAVESVVGTDYPEGARHEMIAIPLDVRVTGNDIWVFTRMPVAGDVLRAYDEATRRVDRCVVQSVSLEGIEIDDGYGGSNLVPRHEIALILS